MDIQIFMQNVKRLLDERRISYSKAGRESGAGIDFVRNMERKNSWPSIEKVSQMADYLGITVGELLGETTVKAGVEGQAQENLSRPEWDMILAYRAADDHAREIVDVALKPWKKKESLDEAM